MAVRYLAFEGGDGTGKSTQVARLAERLDAVATREPGGTALGAALRRHLLERDQAPIGPRAETLLMATDRAQHLVEVIRPALDAGRHVISDRSAYSSLAYQGGGRQLGMDEVRAVNDWALDGTWPDLVVLLDSDPGAHHDRLGGTPDRLESEAAAFHQRVHDAYQHMAAADPLHWLVIDAAGSIDEVAERVWAAVGPRL